MQGHSSTGVRNAEENRADQRDKDENAQEHRVARYAETIGRRSFKWHGDTTQGERKAFLREPSDILLTTPESLEAMLMSTRVPVARIFAGLRAVVVVGASDDRLEARCVLNLVGGLETRDGSNARWAIC